MMKTVWVSTRFLSKALIFDHESAYVGIYVNIVLCVTTHVGHVPIYVPALAVY